MASSDFSSGARAHVFAHGIVTRRRFLQTDWDRLVHTPRRASRSSSQGEPEALRLTRFQDMTLLVHGPRC